jgi:O-antigen/teichoic acid export membrane protein
MPAPNPTTSDGRRATGFLVFKAANTALGILWGFLFTYVLVRALGHGDFTVLLVANGVALSLSMFDLGIAKVALLSLAYGSSGEAAGRLKPALLMLYFGVAATAFLVVVIGVGLASGPDLIWLLCLFLPGVVLSLPWLMIQQFALADERYLPVEIIDFLRRGIQTAGLLAVLAGLPVAAAFAIYLVSWLASIAAGLRLTGVRVRAILAVPGNARVLKGFGRTNKALLRDSVAFNVMELAIYQFPLLFVPLAFGIGWPVLAADMFFKFHRAATAGFRIGSESQVPAIIRGYRARSRRDVLASVRRVALLTAAVLVVMAVVLGPFGDRVITLLLGKENAIPQATLLCALAFCAANAVQNTAGSFLVHVGRLDAPRAVNIGVCLAILGLAAVTLVLELEFIPMIAAYTVCYGAGAVLLALRMAQILRSMGENEASRP